MDEVGASHDRRKSCGLLGDVDVPFEGVVGSHCGGQVWRGDGVAAPPPEVSRAAQDDYFPGAVHGVEELARDGEGGAVVLGSGAEAELIDAEDAAVADAARGGEHCEAGEAAERLAGEGGAFLDIVVERQDAAPSELREVALACSGRQEERGVRACANLVRVQHYLQLLLGCCTGMHTQMGDQLVHSDDSGGCDGSGAPQQVGIRFG